MSSENLFDDYLRARARKLASDEGFNAEKAEKIADQVVAMYRRGKEVRTALGICVAEACAERDAAARGMA